MSASFIKELDHPEVLLLGDSILYHVQRYPHVLQGREVCNMCVPGQKSYRLYDDLDFVKDKASHLLSPDHPYCQRNVSKIVVHIGTNDLPLYLENPGSISQRLIDIIELIQDRIHRTSPTGSKSVYLLGLLPCQGKNDPETFLDDIKEINALLEKHFRGQGIFIKPPRSLADADGTIADHFFHTDKLHLSEEGLRKIFKCIFDFVDNPYNNVIKSFKTKKQLDDCRFRRLRRRRLAEHRLEWCDNRRWSDWVF